jgi:PleD family two-component response regulator
MILAAVEDLFFASKIRAVAEELDVKVKFVRSLAGAVEAAKAEAPTAVIADLHGQRIDPVQLASEFKNQDTLRSIPLVGYFSHVDVGLRDSAQNAGFDYVMPRSAFTNRLPDILSGRIEG